MIKADHDLKSADRLSKKGMFCHPLSLNAVHWILLSSNSTMLQTFLLPRQQLFDILETFWNRIQPMLPRRFNLLGKLSNL